jgi:hypothetical protein
MEGRPSERTGHRRRRLHRQQLRAGLAGPDRRTHRQPGRAHLRRQPAQPGLAARRCTPPFVHGDITDRAPAGPAAGRAPPARRGALCGREPRRPQHPRPRRLHEDQRRRHLHAAGSRARPLVGLQGRDARPSASTTSAPTRSTAAWRPTPPPSPNTTLRTQQPLQRQQGRQRPPGARLAPHLRPAGAHHQLQQQLRALSLPGKAHPADDRQRAGRQAAAHLRRRPAGARLALCGDHCSAIRTVLAKGRPGEVYNVGGWNEKANIEIVHTVCALLDELRPSAEGPYKPPDHLREGPPRPRPPLRHRRAQDRARTGLAPGRDLRHRHPQDGAVVPGPCRLGGRGAEAAATATGWPQQQYGA